MRNNEVKPVKASYRSVRSMMLPGDVIAFSGRNTFNIGTAIATMSNVTHVGVVVHTAPMAEKGRRYQNLLAEATIPSVRISRLSCVIKQTDNAVWWLPLSKESRAKLDLMAFFDAVWGFNGRAYDMGGAIKSAFDFAKWQKNNPDASKLFCSELVCAALVAGKVIKKANYSETTPGDLVRFGIYEPTYYQLKGNLSAIPGFNQTYPEGWEA